MTPPADKTAERGKCASARTWAASVLTLLGAFAGGGIIGSICYWQG